jgi:hypothetical protein
MDALQNGQTMSIGGHIGADVNSAAAAQAVRSSWHCQATVEHMLSLTRFFAVTDIFKSPVVSQIPVLTYTSNMHVHV